MSFVDVDDKKVYYEEYGNKANQTIVYFHRGPGESCLSYTYQAKVLGEKYHVISFDQYGVFRSDALAENEKFGVIDQVELIEKMRINLGINSWIPLGHSYGGMLACQYAYMYPDSTDAVIYDCPMWNVLLTSKTIAAAALPFYEANGIDENIKVCREVLSDLITPEKAFDKAMSLEMNEQLREFLHVIDSKVYEKYMTDFIPQVDVPEEDWYKYINFTKMLLAKGDFYDDYLCRLSEIKKPSLLIVGEYDITCGKDQQEWFCKNSENGRFIMLEKSAHLSWVEYPQKYTQLIAEFVDSLK